MRVRILPAALGLALAVAPIAPVGTQAVVPGDWEQLRPPASPPVPGYGELDLMAFDAAHQLVVLFNGDQTWTFDGYTWRQQHPATSPSTGSVSSALTYDGTTGKVLLLQGLRDNLEHTWLWDGTTWTEQHSAVEPPSTGPLAYDTAANQVVLQVDIPAQSQVPSHAETWTWNGVTWALQHPATEAPVITHLVDDPATASLLAYGNSSTAAGWQTWNWDGANWIQQHPPASPPQNCNDNPGSFDGAEVVFLSGGPCGGGGTWAWDGTTWFDIQSSTVPSPRYQYQMAFDGVRAILFGGIKNDGSGVPLNETWAWSSGARQLRPWTGGHDVVGVGQGGTDAYFAEGYTGLNFDEYLTVQNPGAAQTLTVDYLNDHGRVITRQHALAAQSRTTILVNADVGPGQTVSAHLHAPNAFIAERPMYFTWSGDSGGHDAMGAQSLALTYYFAEGYTGTGFTEFLTLMNPGALAHVAVTYYFNDGTPPKTVPHQVGATSRATILVNDPAEAGPNKEVSVRVVSDQPILAERPMYFFKYAYPGDAAFPGESGGSDVVGGTTLMTDQYLAEGHVGRGFDEYLTILNTNPSPTDVTITYYLASGAPVPQTLTVPGNSRRTIHVNDVLPGGSDSSVHIHSTLPVLVERPMYFIVNAGWTGGHVAMAVPASSLGLTQHFAEGFVGQTFSEYYTIMNPDATRTAHVTITYYDAAGHPTPVMVTIAPQRRWTETVNADLPAGTANSATITSDIPILAERPMYFSY